METPPAVTWKDLPLHLQMKMAGPPSVGKPFPTSEIETFHPVQVKRAITVRGPKPRGGTTWKCLEIPAGTLEDGWAGGMHRPAATLTQTLDQRHKEDGWEPAAGGQRSQVQQNKDPSAGRASKLAANFRLLSFVVCRISQVESQTGPLCFGKHHGGFHIFRRSSGGDKF